MTRRTAAAQVVENLSLMASNGVDRYVGPSDSCFVNAAGAAAFNALDALIDQIRGAGDEYRLAVGKVERDARLSDQAKQQDLEGLARDFLKASHLAAVTAARRVVDRRTQIELGRQKEAARAYTETIAVDEARELRSLLAAMSPEQRQEQLNAALLGDARRPDLSVLSALAQAHPTVRAMLVGDATLLQHVNSLLQETLPMVTDPNLSEELRALESAVEHVIIPAIGALEYATAQIHTESLPLPDQKELRDMREAYRDLGMRRAQDPESVPTSVVDQSPDTSLRPVRELKKTAPGRAPKRAEHRFKLTDLPPQFRESTLRLLEREGGTIDSPRGQEVLREIQQGAPTGAA